MQGRFFGGQPNYRFGFNGKENDDEAKGYGNQVDYGARIYDTRIGRFLSLDPLQKKYPELTPYQFASNSPIQGIDLDGLEISRFFSNPISNGALGIAGTWLTQSIAETKYNQAHGVPDPGFFVHYQHKLKTMAVVSLVTATALYGGENFWSMLPSLMYDPVVQSEIVGGLAALAGYEGPDIPSPNARLSSTFTRTWEEVEVLTKGGKEVSRTIKATARLTMEAGSEFSNEGEKRVTQKLLSEGNDILVKAEVSSSIQGQKSGKNADILVNGIKTEIKTISSVSDLSKAIKIRLSKASAQAKNIIIDLADQKGATFEEAEKGVIRYFNQSKGNIKEVRVMGKDFDKIIQNKNYKGG